MFKFCIGILTFIQVMTLIKWTFKILFNLFYLLLNMLVNFLLLLHNLLSWVTYIQKVARFITGDTIVSVIISTRQDENCDEAALNKVLFRYSRDFPFQLTNITVVLRTRTYIFQGRNVNKYLLKNMERM